MARISRRGFRARFNLACGDKKPASSTVVRERCLGGHPTGGGLLLLRYGSFWHSPSAF